MILTELSFIWAGLIAFSVLAYVVLDGFDLGVGILFKTLPRGEGHRAQAMNTIAPVWDGNETWLVMGGGGLFAAFPLAYAVIMSALYIPVIVMLLALIFRGVAFEFRWRAAKPNRVWWDAAFFGGSVLAAFAQGVTLGALVEGIEIAGRSYAGGPWDWLSPFALLTGLALVTGYALLGATWLVLKTTGWLQARMRRTARVTGAATIAMIGAISFWTPFLHPSYVERWFAWPQAIYTSVVPLMTAGAVVSLWYGLRKEREVQPFLSALALFVLCFAGLGVGFYPYIVPHALTIREASAPDESLWFLLVGAAVLIPTILAYTAYAYWVFRGKVRHGEGYH